MMLNLRHQFALRGLAQHQKMVKVQLSGNWLTVNGHKWEYWINQGKYLVMVVGVFTDGNDVNEADKASAVLTPTSYLTIHTSTLKRDNAVRKYNTYGPSALIWYHIWVPKVMTHCPARDMILLWRYRMQGLYHYTTKRGTLLTPGLTVLHCLI